MRRRSLRARIVGLVLPLVIIAVLTPGFLQQVSAQVGGALDLTWSTIDGGGATDLTGGVFSMSGSAGQPDAGTASGGGFALFSGFWGAAESASPTLLIDDVSLAEGNSGTTSFTFTVTLTTTSNQTVTVNAQTAPDSATAPSDFTSAPSTQLSFPPLSTTQTFTVVVNGDTQNEGNEQFFVNLSGATNATIADAQGVGTILNDDGAPALSISDVSLPEGNSGATSFVFTVALSPAAGQQVTVQAQTADGTATAGTDYTSVGPITLTFAPGVTTQLVTVPILADTLPEGDETFAVTLKSAVNATILDGQAVGVIVNDDIEYQNDPGDDDTDRNRKETEEQRQQRQRTDRSSQDDVRTEGNVVEIRRDSDPPVVVIANRDGLVELRLFGEALEVLDDVEVGQYVTASGEKETEQIYNIDDLSID